MWLKKMWDMNFPAHKSFWPFTSIDQPKDLKKTMKINEEIKLYYIPKLITKTKIIFSIRPSERKFYFQVE